MEMQLLWNYECSLKNTTIKHLVKKKRMQLISWITYTTITATFELKGKQNMNIHSQTSFSEF